VLPFSTQGILSRCPGNSIGSMGTATTTCAQSIGIRYLPDSIPFTQRRFAFAPGRLVVFTDRVLHSGLPFTVLSQPYTANGNGVFQASGPQFARRVPGVNVYRKTAYPGVTVAGTKQWLNPDAFVSSLTRRREHAREATQQPTASLAMPVETPFAGRTSPTRTCT